MHLKIYRCEPISNSCLTTIQRSLLCKTIQALLNICPSLSSWPLDQELWLSFPGSSAGKESSCNVGDLGLILGLGRSPRGRHGNPLQYFSWRIPMGRGAWWATIHGLQRVGHDWVNKHMVESQHFPRSSEIPVVKVLYPGAQEWRIQPACSESSTLLSILENEFWKWWI